MLKDQFQLGDRHYIVLHDEQRVGFGLPETITEEDIGENLPPYPKVLMKVL